MSNEQASDAMMRIYNDVAYAAHLSVDRSCIRLLAARCTSMEVLHDIEQAILKEVENFGHE